MTPNFVAWSAAAAVVALVGTCGASIERPAPAQTAGTSFSAKETSIPMTPVDDSNWMADGQEIAANSLFFQGGLKSGFPLPDSAEIAAELNGPAAEVLRTAPPPELRLPAGVLEVNSVAAALVKAVAGGGALKNPGARAKMRWRPRVYGLVRTQVMEKGCSDIPLYEDFSVMLRYEVSLNVESVAADGKMSEWTPLRFVVDDPTPVYIRTRCWKFRDGQFGSYTKVYVRDGRAAERLRERAEAVGKALQAWYSIRLEEFEDNVQLRIATAKGATPRQAVVKTEAGLRLSWTFTADEALTKLLAGLPGASCSPSRRHALSEVVKLKRHPCG